MRNALVSSLKSLAFLGLWAALIAAVVMIAVTVGGEDWFAEIGWRFWTEIGGAIAILAALVFMARVVDKRGLGTIGLSLSAAPFGLVAGTFIGAAIFALPLVVLVGLDAARFAPDFAAFSATALGLGLALSLFNVFSQELLVRSYIFQELWSKFGAITATIATTALFVALHAAVLMQGTLGLIAGLNILLASLMLSIAYVRTGALWLPIGLHFGWNGLQGPVLGINVSGAEIGLGGWRAFEFPGPALLTGGELGMEGGAIGLIGPAVGLVIVALMPRMHRSG